uniref:Plastid lipid-associated protein/fibrillin conserved domain-containing protein n=1 Tax=Corethron hystrix TaxID=216773 RepID=A0A7S1BFR2_9STRA|mmetsp:Transcript_25899/g.59643  ORF Transcript_25899/g.59643 Transcript_25899/m.59643 type:complete len:283 (+) Transcript_25899:242-1090(+)
MLCSRIINLVGWLLLAKLSMTAKAYKFGLPNANRAVHTSCASVLSASKSSDASPSISQAQFEMQELRANLNSIVGQDIPPILIPDLKREELMTYLGAILSDFHTRFDNVDERGWRGVVYDAMMGTHRAPNSVGFGGVKARAETLAGSTWKLAFSTEGTVLSQLPKGANVFIDFLNEKNLEYKLVFDTKGSWFALNNLVAKSSYAVDAENSVGLVTYTYKEVTAGVFGNINLPVGLFGMLKGQMNYIYPAYYDGNIWVEFGVAPDGEEYYSIFVHVKKLKGPP